MTLSQRLLEKLACPVCHGRLEYNKQDEKLTCPVDKLSFKVIDEIPLLNLDQAEKID